jgi:signal transduction histidine kinase
VEPKLAFEGRLQGDIETHLFRIAQEALTNVARHSGATSATVSLLEDNGRLRLSVEDNGRGLPGGRSQRSGFGLIGMRERMRAAGGLLRVQSGEGGVTVIAEVPLHAITSV